MNKTAKCERDKTDPMQKRKHAMIPKTDGQGREFESCDNCGIVFVTTYKATTQ